MEEDLVSLCHVATTVQSMFFMDMPMLLVAFRIAKYSLNSLQNISSFLKSLFRSHFQCKLFKEWPIEKPENHLPNDYNSLDPHCHECGHLKSSHNTHYSAYSITPEDIQITKQIGTGMSHNELANDHQYYKPMINNSIQNT